MLPQSKEKLNMAQINANRFTVRLKFLKVGNLQYISHLDLQRTFNRIIKRSGIPAWYTMGFNPHLKLVFSSPLSIGCESVCEYLDLSMDGVIGCEEIMERLNRELTEELKITRAYIPQRKFSDIAWAEYEYEFSCGGLSEDTANKANKLFSESPLYMTKKTKSGEKEIDIVPLIANACARYDASSGKMYLFARLSATSDKFLNPEMLVVAMRDRLSLMAGDPTKEFYSIVRKRLLDADGNDFE